MRQDFFFIIGILLFVLNAVFVGTNIQEGNYGLAALNGAAGILVLLTCVILPAINR